MIRCIPLVERMYICPGCNYFIAFDSNNHCYACECDSPVGSLDDETISQEQWESEVAPMYFIWIGDIVPFNGEEHHKIIRSIKNRL